jgi:succinoglycan biosynthesis transport protein ExoP
VLVASAGPGEGKTLVASNLAIALAQAGQRVLIIDGDLRRPRLHDVFGVKQEPGLSNLIVGDAKPADVIRTTTTGVTVLPSGRIPPNPAELLGSRRFHELLTRLKEHFDWIVIDSAPVMAVTDAAVVGHMVSGVVFVVSSEMTNRYNARTAIDHLIAARSHLLGAVLNRVDLDGHAYYYGRYYRREYGEYYQSRQVS